MWRGCSHSPCPLPTPRPEGLVLATKNVPRLCPMCPRQTRHRSQSPFRRDETTPGDPTSLCLVGEGACGCSRCTSRLWGHVPASLYPRGCPGPGHRKVWPWCWVPRSVDKLAGEERESTGRWGQEAQNQRQRDSNRAPGCPGSQGDELSQVRRGEVRRKPEKQVRARPPGPCAGAALPQVSRGSRPRLDPTFQAGLGPSPFPCVLQADPPVFSCTAPRLLPGQQGQGQWAWVWTREAEVRPPGAGQALGCVGRAPAEPVPGTRGPQLPCPPCPPRGAPLPADGLPVRDPGPERC